MVSTYGDAANKIKNMGRNNYFKTGSGRNLFKIWAPFFVKMRRAHEPINKQRKNILYKIVNSSVQFFSSAASSLWKLAVSLLRSKRSCLLTRPMVPLALPQA